MKIEDSHRRALAKYVSEGRLACASAFAAAKELGITPEAVGKMADKMGIRLMKCQLGLFGYGATFKEKKFLSPEPSAAALIEAAVMPGLTDGVLLCRDAWEIARKLEVPKMAVSGFCQDNSIKIKRCQIGAF